MPSFPYPVGLKKSPPGHLNFAQQSAMTMDEAVVCVESGVELAVAEIRAVTPGGHR